MTRYYGPGPASDMSFTRDSPLSAFTPLPPGVIRQSSARHTPGGMPDTRTGLPASRFVNLEGANTCAGTFREPVTSTFAEKVNDCRRFRRRPERRITSVCFPWSAGFFRPGSSPHREGAVECDRSPQDCEPRPRVPGVEAPARCHAPPRRTGEHGAPSLSSRPLGPPLRGRLSVGVRGGPTE